MARVKPPREVRYKALLLAALDELEDLDPRNRITTQIIATLWSEDDLAGLSDRFTGLRVLPPHVRQAVVENAEREGRAIIAAKPEPISHEEWAAQVEARRRKEGRDE